MRARWIQYLGALGTALLLWPSGAAHAADFAISGLYRDVRGNGVEIPLPPGLGQAGPGVPVDGTAMQTGPAIPGGGPASLTIGTGAVYDPRNFEGFLIPVPTFIQLTTSIDHRQVSPAAFRSGSGPGSFAFCPGAAANPNCTTAAAGGSQGTLNGIVKYTAGPNQFGGTLKVLISGIGGLYRKGGALPPTTMTDMGATVAALPFSASISLLGGSATVAPGYVSTTMKPLPTLPPGNRTHPLGYMSTSKGLLTPGAVIGAAIGARPSSTGFPFTTGRVYAYQQFGSQLGAAAVPEKRTITGYDQRTSLGAGRISLVAGGLGRNPPADGSNPTEGSFLQSAHLTIALVPQPALPLAGTSLLGITGLLVLLSAGAAIPRKR